MNDSNRKKDSGGNGMAIGMALGLCIGTAIGAATDNIGLWLPVGLCLGVALGSAFNTNKDNEDGISDETDESKEE